jgi:C4-dicarboxylate-specific signal transduction histidine kinase
MSQLDALSLQRPRLGERARAVVDTAQPTAIRYGTALVLVAAAIAVTLLLQYFQVEHNRFQFYAAIAAAAWFGGAGPGCMAVVLSTLGIEYFFTAPLFNLAVEPREVPDFLTFILCAAVSVTVSARLRRAERALVQARQTLEATVAERAAELRESNLALTVEIVERERADRARAESEATLAETQAQLARVLRIATIAECAAVAHEVNQPLTAIAANAAACLRSLHRDPPALDLARDAVAGIANDTARASAVISRIGGLLRNRKPSIAPVDLNAITREVLLLACSAADKDGVVIRTSLSRSLPAAAGDAVYLQQVLLNLVTNAIEAMRGVSDRSRVLTVRSRLTRSGSVLTEIEDTGIGLAAADPDRMFESFYTTKAEGLGMGLSISQSIIGAHGGRLWASPGRRHGAVFHVALPVAAASGV